MSVGGASFFAEPKSWNSTLEAWNRLLGCKAGLITLIRMFFFAVRNVLGFVRSQIGTTHACINLLPDLRPRIQREREKASRIIGGLGKARESGCTCPKVP